MNDLLFWIQTHNDAIRLAHCLHHLRECYPQVPVVVYVDRDPQRDLSTHVAHRFDCVVDEYAGNVHTYRPERVHEVHVNRSGWHLRFDTEFAFKLDTDALVLRPLKDMPSKCLFGRLVADRQGWFIQGGSVGFDRHVSQQIAEMEPPSMEEIQRHFDATLKMRHQPRDEQGHPLCSEDRYLGWLARSRRIAMCDYPYIRSYWRRTAPANEVRYAAIVHSSDSYPDGERIIQELV